MTMMDPAGMPGTLNVVGTTVRTTDSICVAVSSMPYRRAMKSTAVGCATAPATRYVDAASGRKKPEISAGSPRRVRALSIIAGSAASEDRELNATA